jgi:hypothetical protein
LRTPSGRKRPEIPDSVPDPGTAPFRSNDCQKGRGATPNGPKKGGVGQKPTQKRGAGLEAENGHTTKKATPGAPKILEKRGGGDASSWVMHKAAIKTEFLDAATRVRERRGISLTRPAPKNRVHRCAHSRAGSRFREIAAALTPPYRTPRVSAPAPTPIGTGQERA